MTSGASLPCTQDDLLSQLEREIASVKQELQETRWLFVLYMKEMKFAPQTEFWGYMYSVGTYTADIPSQL